MSVSKPILCLIVILAGVLSGHAQENAQSPPPPPKYHLELVRMVDGESGEFIFVVGKLGFKSVASLKQFLSSVPPGSILEWAPGCIRIGGEPLLSSDEAMENFKAFCVEKQINFILVPAG